MYKSHEGLEHTDAETDFIWEHGEASYQEAVLHYAEECAERDIDRAEANAAYLLG